MLTLLSDDSPTQVALPIQDSKTRTLCLLKISSTICSLVMSPRIVVRGAQIIASSRGSNKLMRASFSSSSSVLCSWYYWSHSCLVCSVGASSSRMALPTTTLCRGLTSSERSLSATVWAKFTTFHRILSGTSGLMADSSTSSTKKSSEMCSRVSKSNATWPSSVASNSCNSPRGLGHRTKISMSYTYRRQKLWIWVSATLSKKIGGQ